MVVTDTGVAVNGRIDCDSIYVNSTGLNVPDYVFEDRYPLKSLEELIRYIQTHGHLPGLPDASSKAEWGKLDLQTRDMKLLEKIEEMMLYIIQLKRTNDNQEQINNTLQKKIEYLENLIMHMKEDKSNGKY